MEPVTNPERQASGESKSGLDFNVGRYVAFVWTDRSWVQVALFFALFAGMMSSDAYARCGQAPRQMLWRFGTTAELLRWEAPELRAGPQPVVFDVRSEMSDSSHSEPWGGCTKCQSKDDTRKSVPLVPQGTGRSVSDMGLASEEVDNLCSPSFSAMNFVPDEVVFSIDLEGFERPPRA